MTEFHPRRKDKEITDKSEMDRILKCCKYAVIGMAAGDEPYVVSLSYGYDRENGRLYFHCALKGTKLDFLARNPKVCATVIEDRGYSDGKCEHPSSSLVIRGIMRIVTEIAEKKHGLDVILGHLESNPAPAKDRNIKNDASYDKIAILCLSTENTVGKRLA